MTESERSIDIKTPTDATNLSDDSEFATFENPLAESVGYHVRNHWPDLRVSRVGDSAADTQDVVVSCSRCEVRYRLDNLPSRRIPGTEAFERLRS